MPAAPSSLARLDVPRMLFAHAGWPYDAYPDLPELTAGSTIVVADFEGPGVIDHIQMTQNGFLAPANLDPVARKAVAARGVILEVYYDGARTPSVRVPVGDFFGDACRGAAIDFTTPFLEKAPGSYHSWIPMPFEKSIRIVLVNQTELDFPSNTMVEGHRLAEWDPGLGLFHATWDRVAFAATPDTERTLTHIEGRGHLLGRSWSLATDEPWFTQTEQQQKFAWIMEANNEIRIDGEDEPSVVYVGSEDSFGFCWGFTSEFAGLRNGIVHLGENPETLGMYRFWDPEPLRFDRSLDVRLTWRWEARGSEFRNLLDRLGDQGRLWIDYATTTYWYQDHLGFEHAPLPPLEVRLSPLLHPNPVAD